MEAYEIQESQTYLVMYGGQKTQAKVVSRDHDMKWICETANDGPLLLPLSSFLHAVAPE